MDPLVEETLLATEVVSLGKDVATHVVMSGELFAFFHAGYLLKIGV